MRIAQRFYRWGKRAMIHASPVGTTDGLGLLQPYLRTGAAWTPEPSENR